MQKYIDDLINLVSARKIRLNDIITHRLSLDDAPHGYQIFKDRQEDCVKVVLQP